jgi:UDP-N-acetylmuramate--alanine ligase
MNIYFSGIGGTGIGPLAVIAAEMGYSVFGSDKQESEYTKYLQKHGVNNFHIGQDTNKIAARNTTDPIDWFVYSSALPKDNPNHPELLFCQDNNIKTSKRDEFLVKILADNNLNMLAVAGTHGKTTTTAMWVWLLKELGIPISYSLGAKTSFADMGHYELGSQYFVYECDEYDRNFLSFNPYISIITGVTWDHADIYPTEQDYNQAFSKFASQSKSIIGWDEDAAKITDVLPSQQNNPKSANDRSWLNKNESKNINLVGAVNRQNALEVIEATKALVGSDAGIAEIIQRKLGEAMTDFDASLDEYLLAIIEKFPGVARRFEKLANNIYTDYAHTAEKIAGAINTAKESSKNVVVVYEGLHNRRQHFMLEQNQFAGLFDGVKHLYWVPSYLAREDPSQETLVPAKLIELTNYSAVAEPAELNTVLLGNIKQHAASGDLVLCVSAGGGGSLDEWLRNNLKS